MAREMTSGWESGSVTAEGTDGAGASAVGTGGGLHLDGAGNGGSYHLVGSGATASPTRQRFQRVFARNLVEGWYRAMIKLTGVSASAGIVLGICKDTTEVASVRILNSTGVIELYRGALSTLLASSAGGAVPIGQYVVLDIHYRISDTVGLFEVFVDDTGAYTTPAVTFSGDTKPGADADWNTIGVGASTSNYVDEVGVNSITMRYDGGTGTAPTAGQTVTGGTSGATAVITAVEGDATSGKLVLQQWNGTNFVDNEAITTASLNALVNAPHSSFASGFEPNSKALGEGFVVHLIPNGAGATTQLTPSAGSNFQCVDEVPPNTRDYVSSSTAVAPCERHLRQGRRCLHLRRPRWHHDQQLPRRRQGQWHELLLGAVCIGHVL
jgi:hypothetical protein